MLFDYVVGAGQGGCRIAKTFQDHFNDVDVCFMNLAKVDFSQLNVSKGLSLILNAGGSGRNPDVGEKIAKQNKDAIEMFLENQFPNMRKNDRVAVCIGGGGGSGAGMMYIVLEWLLRRKADILLIYTLPEKSEGLPAKPNALKSLNKIIKEYLEADKLTAMVVDNSFCAERFGYSGEHDLGDYWSDINQGIVKGLRRFYYLTNLDHFSEYIDVNTGYGALDERELIRVMFAKGGFIDLRECRISNLDIEAAENAVFKSLIFGNLDIGSTKSYIATIGFPNYMRNNPNVSVFTETIFKRLEKITKTSFVLRSTHFNKSINEIKINILLSGLIKSHGLKKIVNQTVKDVARYKAKGGIESLDLNGLDY